MGEDSKIQWCEHSYNPWWGCVKCSVGCENCYAETMSRRFGHDVWGRDKHRRIFGAKHWNEPRKWNRKAKEAGEPAFVFCGSMCDVFEKHRDPEYNHEVLDRQRGDLWHLIEETPWLVWLLLTKRPQNIDDMIPERWVWNGLPRNVWLGYSASTQEDLDVGWPVLALTAHWLRTERLFLSLEPLVEPISLAEWLEPINLGDEEHDVWLPLPAWVIGGGESGPRARPMDWDWVRILKTQCVGARIPFFFKQAKSEGKMLHCPMLDGRKWMQRPLPFPSEAARYAAILERAESGSPWSTLVKQTAINSMIPDEDGALPFSGFERVHETPEH